MSFLIITVVAAVSKLVLQYQKCIVLKGTYWLNPKQQKEL